MTPIRYCGKRPRYTEGTYGSRIEFTQGETVLVPDDLAKKLLAHKDVYELGDDPDAAAAIIPEPNPNTEPDENVQAARDLVANMDTKESLSEYAAINFNGHKLDPKLSIPKLRTEVTRLIDLYGVT